MLFVKGRKIILMLLLINLINFSNALNLKKQFDVKNFNNEKEMEHLFRKNNTFSIPNDNKESEKNKINLQNNKHNPHQEHLDLDLLLSINYSKSEDFYNKHLEIDKRIDEISNLDVFNRTSHSQILSNFTEGLSKTDKDIIYSNAHEAQFEVNENNKTEIKQVKQESSQFNKTEIKDENNANTKYDFVYYPMASGSKFNLPLRRDGVFGCRGCANAEEDSRNSMNFKVPNEDKWVKLQPVKFVKQISPVSKAALEIENIEDPEYKRILKSGYKNPRFIRDIVRDFPTNVQKPTNVNSVWKPAITLNPNIWQNVDYNLYTNQLMDTSRFNTPASFSYSEAGSPIVNAPSNAQMQMISAASNTINSSPGDEFGGLELFIETETKESYIDNPQEFLSKMK